MDDKTFVYVTFIKTTAEKLWQALTDSSIISRYWFGSSFETVWKEGTPIREIHDNGKTGFQGEILKYEPFELLSYSFVTSDKIETVVSFQIESAGEMVTLKTTHTGYERGSKIYRSTSIGWAAIHSGLKTLLETGKPLNQDSVYKLYDLLTKKEL